MRPYLLRYAALQLRDAAALPRTQSRTPCGVHLAICNGCRNANQQFRILRLAVKELAQDGDNSKPG